MFLVYRDLISLHLHSDSFYYVIVRITLLKTPVLLSLLALSVWKELYQNRNCHFSLNSIKKNNLWNKSDSGYKLYQNAFLSFCNLKETSNHVLSVTR